MIFQKLVENVRINEAKKINDIKMHGVLQYASSNKLSDKSMLRKIISDKLGVVIDLPYFYNNESSLDSTVIKQSNQMVKVKNIEDFVNKYNKLWKTKKDLLTKIFRVTDSGIGKGEVLLSLLLVDLSINGGSGDFDASFQGKEFEVKEVLVKNQKGLWGYNYRFGKNVKLLLKNIVKEIQEAIYTIVINTPELNTPENIEKVMQGYELTSFLKYLKAKKQIKLDVINCLLLKNDKILYNNKEYTFNEIKKVFDIEISYKHIIKDIENILDMHSNVEHLFFGGQTKNDYTAKLFYKPKLKPVDIESFTQGSIKLKIKLED